MKRILILALLFTGALRLAFCQVYIDIEIDQIHCQDGSCYFLNISNEDVYKCDIESHELGRDVYSYAVDCSYSHSSKSPVVKVNELNLQKITNLDDFTSWAENKRFYAEYEIRGQKNFDLIQPINKRYVAISSKKYIPAKVTWTSYWEDVYELIPIRINNEYFVGGLVELGYHDIDFLLLPTKDGKGKLVDNRHIYNPTNRSEKISLDVKREILDSYQVRIKNGKSYITNSLSNNPIIEGLYDEISIGNPFVVTNVDNKISIYNQLLEKIDLPRIQAAYHDFGSLQIITDNRIKWLTEHGEISDTMETRSFGMCGNNPCNKNTIQPNGDHFIETVTDCSYSSYKNASNSDTFSINLRSDIVDIKYLNGMSNMTFSYSYYNRYFTQKENLYYFKTKSGQEGIFKRINEKNEAIKHTLKDLTGSNKEKWEVEKQMRKSLATSYKYEIVFEGKFEQFKLQGYSKPIMFKQNELYGIYPQMTIAKYKSIGEFINYLAEVTFENGEEGWIDLTGKEIPKQ